MLKKNELKTIREAFEASQGHDCRLTDDAISAIIERVTMDKYAEMDEDEQMSLLTKAEDAFKGIAIADPGITGLVSKFDEAFNKELEACLDATVKAKTSAVDIYAQFKRIYSKAQLDACPMPGTDKDDVAGTNYKADIIEKPAIAGGKIRTVFTHDWVQATAKGKAFQTDIDDVKKETDNPGTVARFKGKSKKELRSITASATQGRNAMRSMFSRALRLHHKLSAIEGMPKVSFQWIGGHDKAKCPIMPKVYGKADGALVSLTPKPLWFMPRDPETGKDDGSEGRDFSVTQVLAFDVAKALKGPDGGTLAELVASSKAIPDPEEKAKGMTIEKLESDVTEVDSYLRKREAIAELTKRMNSPDQDELISSVCSLYLSLKPVYAKFQAKYEAIEAADVASKAKELELKQAANA
jgi:hypothetical protein